MEFELSTTTSLSKEGNTNINVVEEGTATNITTLQKLRFTIYSKEDVRLKEIAAHARLMSEENKRRWSVGYEGGPVT